VAGERWFGHEMKTITWQSTFIDSVSILLKNGVTVLWSKNELASKGSIILEVPMGIATQNAKVYISEINGSLKDSSAAFGMTYESVNEVSINNFNIYPNPSNGIVYFTTDLNLKNALYEIVDVTGKLIIKDELSKTNSIAIQNKGIYVLKALVDGKSIIRKIVVE
jgi:hypothetical protein